MFAREGLVDGVRGIVMYGTYQITVQLEDRYLPFKQGRSFLNFPLCSLFRDLHENVGFIRSCSASSHQSG